MGEICYKIEEIPDLTLGKYDYLSQNGVGGVLDLHKAFLRQWHEKSILAEVTIHLVYEYKASAKPGQKIKIYFIVRGEDSNLDNIDMIIKGSSLSDYFRFVFQYRSNADNIIGEKCVFETEYSYCSAITKEEIFFCGSDGKTYYDVPLWTPNDDGRLYGMLRMMDAINEDMVYRIDLMAVKKNRTLRKSLSSGPIPSLHQLQSTSNGDRDYGADSVLHDYDELMKALDSSPHFQANTYVFSKSCDNGAMVLAAAVSEAVDIGDYHISTFQNQFSALSFFTPLDRRLSDFSDETNEYYIESVKNGVRIYSENNAKAGLASLNYLTSLFTLEEISPMFRLPCLYDGETINIRKETVAPPVDSDNALYLGLDENKYEINFPVKLLPKHAFISGVPGSGKTNTMHHLTHSLWTMKEKKIPFLVLEPAKKEYRALCNLDDMKELRLFSPSANMMFPLHINPFEFAKGLSVAEHIRTLCSVFEGAFPLDNPMPFLLDTAIEGVYRDMGWRPETIYTDNTNLEFPTMSMLYKRLEEELQKTTYSAEVRGNLESALKVRIGSLLRREMGDVFDVPKSSLTPEEWLTIPAVVELEAMGSGPANFLTLMLCSLIRECLKVNPTFDSNGTRHVIFIEEAHNLIGPDSEEKTGEGANAKTAATAFIVKMLAEVRALRESVFIADQLPTVMAQEVIKNTGLKIALRLTAMDDRQLLCNSMSANNSQIEDMCNFKVGEALISYEGLQRPFKMRVHEWCSDKAKPEKEKLVTPKNDIDLFEHLKDTEAYKDNIARSIEIVGKKFKYEYQKLIDNCKFLNVAIKKHSDVQESIILTQQKIDKNAEKMAEIVIKFDYNAQLTYEMDSNYRAMYDENIRQIKILSDLNDDLENKRCIISDNIGYIRENMDFIAKLQRRLLYYEKLGIKYTEEESEKIFNGQTDGLEKSKQISFFLKHYFMQDLFNKTCLIYQYIAKNGLYTDTRNLYNCLFTIARKSHLNTSLLKEV